MQIRHNKIGHRQIDRLDFKTNKDKDTTDLTSTGLAKRHLFYGPGMQTNWMDTNILFLRFLASKFGQSTKASLLAETLVVTEVDSSKLPKFKTKKEKAEYLATLEFWEQEECEETKEDYQKFSRIIRKDLAAVCGILDSMCHISLRSRLEAEPKYQKMISNNLFSTITLFKLVRKICNESTFVLVEDVIGNAVEAMHSVMILRGEDYPYLPKYLEAATQKHKCFLQARCRFATEQLRDAYLEE